MNLEHRSSRSLECATHSAYHILTRHMTSRQPAFAALAQNGREPLGLITFATLKHDNPVFFCWKWISRTSLECLYEVKTPEYRENNVRKNLNFNPLCDQMWQCRYCVVFIVICDKVNMETRHYWEENGHAVKYTKWVIFISKSFWNQKFSRVFIGPSQTSDAAMQFWYH